jgi:hypothetical protein
MAKKDAAEGAPERTEEDLDQLMEELDALLKSPDVGATLTARGINTSLALLVADALRAYLKGRKGEAAEDLSTAAEEISSRLMHGPGSSGKLPS